MMSRLLILLLCLLAPHTLFAVELAEVDQFLASRQVVAQIYFDKTVAELSPESRLQIDSRVTELLQYKDQQMIIRVEGFSSPDGEDLHNLNLSMQRAMAVEGYLLNRHKLHTYVFMTGFGEKQATDGKVDRMRRVDISVYKINRAAEALFNETGKIERILLQ